MTGKWEKDKDAAHLLAEDDEFDGSCFSFLLNFIIFMDNEVKEKFFIEEILEPEEDDERLENVVKLLMMNKRIQELEDKRVELIKTNQNAEEKLREISIINKIIYHLNAR